MLFRSCRGMAPGVRLVVGKVLDDRGGGSTESMLAGLEWILQVRERYGIRILNISVGIGSLEEETKERALQEKLEEVWESGILVVCAAGNKGPGDGTISGLGESRHVLTVGCHGFFDRFQNWTCVQRFCKLPGNDPSGIQIHDAGKVNESVQLCVDIGDICAPYAVWVSRREVSIQKILQISTEITSYCGLCMRLDPLCSDPHLTHINTNGPFCNGDPS